tara:strand:+ start:47 stop:331 length:285 start_codon:yes stop_codon:yes gene_type:complete
MAEENICPACEAPLRPMRGELKCPSSLCPGVPEVVEEVVEAPEEEDEEEVLEEEDEEEEVDYSSMKVAELKELLKIKGLETTGKKADLIERLEG